jgi:K+-sensing histidine kinase KdpD
MTGKLDDLIACMANIQQHNLDVAIQSEKMKVDLISNVSHDLKTPLTSMIGYIDLIKKEELTPVITDYMTALSAKTEKLKEMIESLFSLAKTSSGNIKLNLEPVKINRLVEQIYADMEEQIQASNLEFISELTVQDTEIMTDSSYIYRIFQNLIENSLKYSANYTRIYIKTSIIELSDTKTVHFELTNTANYRMNFAKDQIIERFTRGDTARTGDGNGLGLAIVSTYTSALGGRFDVLIDCDQFKAILDFDKVPTDTLAQQLYEMEV